MVREQVPPGPLLVLLSEPVPAWLRERAPVWAATVPAWVQARFGRRPTMELLPALPMPRENACESNAS